MGQRFIARERFEFTNGAVGWRPGGPFDCLGPYAKVENCPIMRPTTRAEQLAGAGSFADTGLRRTCYATGYAESFFSVPACCKVKGRHVPGFFTMDDGDCIFVAYVPLDAKPHKWERVDAPHMFGSLASNGNRSALVLRSGEGEWLWFAQRDGRTVVTGERTREYQTERQAQRQAEGYLTTGSYNGRNYDDLPTAEDS